MACASPGIEGVIGDLRQDSNHRATDMTYWDNLILLCDILHLISEYVEPRQQEKSNPYYFSRDDPKCTVFMAGLMRM